MAKAWVGLSCVLVAVAAAAPLSCGALLGDVHDLDAGAAEGATPGDAGCTGASCGDSAIHPTDGGQEASGDTGTPVSVEGGPGCVIGGMTYAPAATNPMNECQACLPAMSLSAWTSVMDGTPCGSGGICHVNSCVSGCEIGNVYYPMGAPEPNSPCQTCQPGTSTSGWTALANGMSCGNGQVCASGLCGTGCVIGGTSYAPGATNPTNACQSCQPGTSTSMWASLAAGSSCGAGEICGGAGCGAGCYIGAAPYGAGTVNPTNVCQVCNPGLSTTSWSAAAPGTTCPSGMCSSGACALGCPGGATEAWQQAQPAWEGNTNTAGTYSCMGTLPPGSTPSGQSVMILASGSMTTTGNATFQCLNGAWFKSTATCDGALIDLLTPPVVVCSSGDPVSTMFIDIYATDLYRCADTAGLQFWVNAYTTADGGVPCAASPAASGCWETLILNDTGADYDAGRALGHLTPDIEKLLCMPNAASPPAGYPWSNVATTIEMLGTKCKYLP